ncbi:hypothetical protein CHS0354_035742 [Potamilus streckersoni]|uniref:C-type lectin domain-containing protein n=1 Tax=Potamilus streckersoni TaxID=2493646 RepID=A0AAE0S049_9BIVA|nr:hypothetical protein CHS0354_035742 [Potamilus streckersoni]
MRTSVVKDPGSGFLIGDAASFSRCPVTVLRTQFLKVYREKCFEFVIDHETYWDNADKDCRSRGGHLATIGDKETQVFIMETLRSIGFNKHGIWIGLNDREHEQHWVWATGENLGSYRNWGNQQGNGITHLTDDCVHLRYIDGGQWHDSPCHLGTYHYTYICQYRKYFDCFNFITPLEVSRIKKSYMNEIVTRNCNTTIFNC